MAATATNTNFASSTYDHEMADNEAILVSGRNKQGMDNFGEHGPSKRLLTTQRFNIALVK